jgi:hypothetical protein
MSSSSSDSSSDSSSSDDDDVYVIDTIRKNKSKNKCKINSSNNNDSDDEIVETLADDLKKLDLSFYKLAEPSMEQLAIISLLETNNIAVDAVAGSGKTTTALHIAKSQGDANTLIIVYNKRLKQETKTKVDLLGIRADVRSFHSMCVKYYGIPSAHTDRGILLCVEKNKKPKENFAFDTIVIDEAQDMSDIYAMFVQKILRDNRVDEEKVKLCIMGDKFQAIYEFVGASPKYLMTPEILYENKVRPWTRATLSTSYRLNEHMLKFMNKHILHYQHFALRSTPDNTKMPQIIIDKSWRLVVCKQIIERHLANKTKVEDIFILAPSVKSAQSPSRQLANSLTAKGIPVYVPSDDDAKIDDDLLHGKIAFLSFHQAKGLERDIVFVLGFDSSYFKYYAKKFTPTVCTNPLYVALTRAKKELYIVIGNKNLPPPFVKASYNIYENHFNLQGSNIYEFINDINLARSEFSDGKDNKENSEIENTFTNEISVTKFIRFIPITTIVKAINCLEYKVYIDKEKQRLNFESKSEQGNLYEDVSAINGLAITSYLEKKSKTSSSIEDYLLSMKVISSDDILSLEKIQKNPGKLLQQISKYLSVSDGYNYRNLQIISFDWMSFSQLRRASRRLEIEMNSHPTALVYEKRLTPLQFGPRLLKGRVDIIDELNKIVYEIKCVRELAYEHYLQLSTYAHMMISADLKYTAYKFVLYNICTGEKVEISSDKQRLTDCFNIIAEFKLKQ